MTDLLQGCQPVPLHEIALGWFLPSPWRIYFRGDNSGVSKQSQLEKAWLWESEDWCSFLGWPQTRCLLLGKLLHLYFSFLLLALRVLHWLLLNASTVSNITGPSLQMTPVGNVIIRLRNDISQDYLLLFLLVVWDLPSTWQQRNNSTFLEKEKSNIQGMKQGSVANPCQSSHLCV